MKNNINVSICAIAEKITFNNDSYKFSLENIWDSMRKSSDTTKIYFLIELLSREELTDEVRCEVTIERSGGVIVGEAKTNDNIVIMKRWKYVDGIDIDITEEGDYRLNIALFDSEDKKIFEKKDATNFSVDK